MAIITISGQYGSRGSEIAKETAKLLDFSLVDRDILATAAQRTGIGIDRWDQKDMKIDTVKDRLSVILETLTLSRRPDSEWCSVFQLSISCKYLMGWLIAKFGPSIQSSKSALVTTVAISIILSESGSNPVISRSNHIRLG